MASKPLDPRKRLFGDNESELRRFHDAIEKELGSDAGAAKSIAGYLKSADANPYLKTRALQIYLRTKEKLDAQTSEDGIEYLSQDEVHQQAAKDTIRFLVTLPEEVFAAILSRTVEIRRQMVARAGQARIAAENVTRPLDAPAAS
jgi:hypothetical protein